jgi:hypothetical protein
MTARIDITHHIYGRWLVLFPVEKDKKGSFKWMCRCDCGEVKAIGVTSLRRGNSKSCGCLVREQSAINSRTASKHNMSHSREYTSWRSMKERCTNIKATGYINYGAVGVKVCDRWMNSFENFYADMGARPPNTSLDRIDPFGHYEPDNCRWANQSTQNKNQKRNLFKEQGICLFLKVKHYN